MTALAVHAMMTSARVIAASSWVSARSAYLVANAATRPDGENAAMVPAPRARSAATVVAA
jgi:hypothetical protein